MFNLDPAKLLVIGVIAVILLGPDRLPQVARQVGGAWRSFNEFRHRMETEVRGSIPDLPSTNEIARLARSPSALLNHLSNMNPDDADKPAGDTSNGTSTASAPRAGAEPRAVGTPSTPAPPTRPMPRPTPARQPDVAATGDPSLN
jgi:sec-independent protein translocase protein TatB